MAAKLSKNLVMEGVLGSEAIDTAGERLIVKGCDISDLEEGKCLLNTEHKNPEDIDPENKELVGFQTIVGRVVTAKKIFDKNDCATERELAAFNKIQAPLIYGTLEIYDGPDAPENAKALSGLIKMFSQDPSGPKIACSVEGSTLQRNGNVLERTVIRRIAMTVKPANRTAYVDLVGNTPAQPSQVAKSERTKDGFERLQKSLDMQSFMVAPKPVNDFGLAAAHANLKKTLTAGFPVAAPSALTDGESLQSPKKTKKSEIQKLHDFFKGRVPSKTAIAKHLLKLDKASVDSIHAGLKAYSLSKTEESLIALYEDFKKNT
jgi:hypothetical protein